jgi:diacylglycerol kinase family enzyme
MNTPDGIVVAGGDGTLFHLLCRLKPPWAPVVLLPNGRGNALARDIGGGREALVDAMRVRAAVASGEWLTCWSLSSIGLGYPAAVTRRAAGFRFLRRFSYAGAALFTLPEWSAYEITRYTGGFEALPQASSADGMTECLELTAGYLAQMAHNLSVMTGLHCYAPVRVRMVKRARITPAEPAELMVDGEMLGRVVSVEAEVMPRMLRVRIARRAEG